MNQTDTAPPMPMPAPTFIPLLPAGTFRVAPSENLTTDQVDALARSAYDSIDALRHRADFSPEALAAHRVQMDMEMREDIAAFQAATNQKYKVACGFGCNHCCTIPVQVTPHEVFGILAWMDTHIGADDLAALRVRLLQRDEAMRKHTPDTRMGAGILCGMNGPNGECMIYEVQPYPCAQYTSFDVGRCVYARTKGNQYPISGLYRQFQAFSTTNKSSCDAFEEAGFPNEPLEITAAMAAALTSDRDEAWRVWSEERRNPWPQAAWSLRGSSYDDGTPAPPAHGVDDLGAA